ncbi:TonB-dependent receptor [Pseudoduganella sp.]|uniref:TonB-dependent receptor n=1 Tax=Pseudoduganella sp. TaxID=1880898 RepID=UPI0035B0321C
MLKETILSRSVRVICAGGLALGMTMASAQEIQRVEITGSSLKRVDSETALPVQVLSKAEITRTGATSTQELLNSVSALSSAGGTNNATGAGSSTYGLSSISLRGLGDERTLVLVNGRRLAAFAGGGGAAVNVNVIPLAAIERVEVLKDGASGVYGSDAVAGVVNFILSKSFEGIEVGAGYGTPTEDGGGQNNKFTITAGFGNLAEKNYSAVISASVENEKALYGSERDFAKNGVRPPYFVNGATGHGNIEGGIDLSKPYPNERIPGFGNSPGTGYGNPLAAAGKCADINMFKNPTNSTKNAPYCTFDSAPFVGLIPKRELKNLTGNFTLKLNDDHQLFADALYSESTVTQRFQGSPLRRSFLETDAEFQKQGVQPSLLLFPSNPVYQSIAVPYLQSLGGAAAALIGQPLAITSRVFDFGPRTSLDKAKQSRFVVGAKGTVMGQDYEVALTKNVSKLNGSVPDGYFSQVKYAKIINDPANNWNPWAAGAVQTGALATKLQEAKYTGDTLNAKSESTLFDGKIAGDLPTLAGITGQYAVGAQFRDEKYKTTPSAALESGDIAGLGGSVPPVDRSRKIKSVFGEANFPILKTLDVGAAVRFDDYNDVGNSTNYKANVRWQPVKSVLVRASAGSGFRAPTLTDLWQPQTTGTSAAFDDPATGQTDLQVNALSGGNPGLRPEESRQKSIGLVLSPINNLTVGFDWFHVKVTDILATPSAQEVVSRFRAGDPAYKNLVTLDGNDIDRIITTLNNTGSADVKGLDVFAQYRLNTSVGRFDIALNGTYMDQYDQTSPGGALSKKVGKLVDADGAPVLGADDGGVVLRWKHALSTTWTQGPWAVTFTQNFTKRYEAGNDIEGNRTFIPSSALYDLNVNWKAWRSLVINAGVRNLFNKEPAIFVPVSNQFQNGYDVTQYDPRGRFVYVSANYTFK